MFESSGSPATFISSASPITMGRVSDAAGTRCALQTGRRVMKETSTARQRRRNTAKRRYCTLAGPLMTTPRSAGRCRRARPECRGRTLRLRLIHSTDAAAPTANDASSAASTAPVEENPYAIPITTPRMFPATIQPIIVSSSRTRLSESATANPAKSTTSNTSHGSDSGIEEV
jgi:hypothetical protein